MALRTGFRIAFAASSLVAMSCASSGSAHGRTTPSAGARENGRSAQNAPNSATEFHDPGDLERIRELEAQLALSRAEAASLRAELVAERETSHARTVRISSRHDEPSELSWGGAFENTSEGNNGSSTRPTLRLYGEPRRTVVEPNLPEEAGSFGTLQVPAGLPPTLPVVPMPGAPIGNSGIATPAVQEAREHDAAVLGYRAALRQLSDRRFDDAIGALTAFLTHHAAHAYADNALYWRGEAHYALRHYAEAIADFEAVSVRYRDGNKTPDALYKLSLCYRRIGDDARAREALRKLLTEYPSSTAARLASQENES